MTDIVLSDAALSFFWSLVDQAGSEECWAWKGPSLKKDNRGVFRVCSKNLIATRIMWRLTHQEWPGDAFVCHSCDNPNCVNPSHLWLGDARSNALDASSKGRLGMQRNPNHSFFATKESNEFRVKGSKHGKMQLASTMTARRFAQAA